MSCGSEDQGEEVGVVQRASEKTESEKEPEILPAQRYWVWEVPPQERSEDHGRTSEPEHAYCERRDLLDGKLPSHRGGSPEEYG